MVLFRVAAHRKSRTYKSVHTQLSMEMACIHPTTRNQASTRLSGYSAPNEHSLTKQVSSMQQSRRVVGSCDRGTKNIRNRIFPQRVQSFTVIANEA